MKIGIIGTRGVPNFYGGFEQFAQYLAEFLVKNGHKVAVYNSHNHPYQEEDWNGVQIIHQFDPEFKLGTAGQFIYDFNCILDSRKRSFDIILQLGYTSSSVWGKFLPKKSLIVTNMDGLEWKRTKYPDLVKKFLLYAERLAVKTSDFLISDSIGIQSYLANKYKVESTYIPYGAELPEVFNADALNPFDLTAFDYDLLIARLEPENNIEVILDGFVLSGSQRKFIVIGNFKTPFGQYLFNKFNGYNVQFLGAIYDLQTLNSLRNYSNLYFHGHSVGGTNPSLLEAMASNSLICAHDNEFNKYILGPDAFYFKTKSDVSKVLSASKFKQNYEEFLTNNLEKISTTYSWNKVLSEYEGFFKNIKSNGI